MRVINPATEATREIVETPLHEIPALIARSRKAFAVWSAVPTKQRAAIVGKLIERLNNNVEALARAITDDMGKPIRQARNEVKGIGEKIKYLCARTPEWLADEACADGMVHFEPLGIAAVISPWNYPIYTSLTGIVHALLAGNSVLFKPSEFALFSGAAIDELFRGLDGLPPDTVLTILGGKEHGRKLAYGDVDIISFTGSTAVGKEIAAASADKLKRVVLELGGMDAAIVLADVDVERCAAEIVRTNAHNTGQVCCSIKRVYVDRKIYPKFVEAAVAESKKISFGDPNGEIDMGPLAGEFQKQKVQEIVMDAEAKGAEILSGGKAPPGPGYYFPSTVVVNVNEQMRIMNEEPFGPVLPVIAVDSWEDAVTKANASRYGLTGSVWTKNIELARKIAAMLQVGNASINSHAAGGHESPWGGAKESGLGRTNIRDGLRQFTNIKYIHEAAL